MSEDKIISGFSFDDTTQIQELLQSAVLSDEYKGAVVAEAKEIEQKIIAANYNADDIDPEIIVKTFTDMQKTIEEMDRLEKAIRAKYGEMGVMLFVWYSGRHYLEEPNVMKFFPFVDRAYNAYKEENHIKDLPVDKIEWEVYVEIIKAAAQEAQEVQDSEAIEGAKRVLEDSDINNKELIKLSNMPDIKKYAYDNDKAIHSIIGIEGTRQEIDGQISFLWSANQARKDDPPLPALISLTQEGGEIKTSRPLTAFDESVYNALCTIIYHMKQEGTEAPYTITPEAIWRIRKGNKGNKDTPTPKQRRDICASIEKMSFTAVYLDISAELKANRFILDDERLIKGKMRDYYINSTYIEAATEKNRTVEAYRINTVPLLYTYSKAKGNVFTVPFEVLDVSDTIKREADYVIEFRDYLLKQIVLMYRKDRNNKKILFETLYSATAIDPPKERMHKSNYTSDNSYNSAVKGAAAEDRKKITALLDSFKNKGFIDGYKMTKKRKAIDGVEIILNKDTQKAYSQKEKIEGK